MDYNDPAVRQAYLAGAGEGVEAVTLKLSAPEIRELEQWLAELAEWTHGEPPQAPHRWEDVPEQT